MRDLPFEFMLNALRLNEGFALADFESRTGLDMDAVEPRAARGARARAARVRAGRVAADGLGRRFLNDLQASFLALSLYTPTGRGPHNRGTYSTLRLH